MSAASCFCCGGDDLRAFYEARDIPVNSCVLLSSRAEALDFPRGDLELGHCARCGFIQNNRFDPALVDYTLPYEEAQGFSPRFRAFARQLAERLIHTYDLHDRQILEVGCGKGEFLELLCELGPNRGIGIDPSHVPERSRADLADRLEFIRDFYSEAYTHLTGDLICCRHTLEHIQPVAEFVALLKASLRRRPGAALFLEVPDVGRVLRERAFWDVYYEHCSYFSAGSMRILLQRAGLDPLDVRTDYDDQYLLAEAQVAEGPPPPAANDAEGGHSSPDVDAFERGYRETVEVWMSRLRDLRDGGRRAVVWGAGSKAVSFLTTLGIGEEVACAIDINPHKHGKYLPGTGHEVVAPEALRDSPPDVVVIMNPIYREEIGSQLAELGVDCEILTV